jgi:AmiR/NasT family two-component response regulator
MSETEHRLQVLVANEQHARLGKIKVMVEALGHEIVGSAVDIGEVGPLSRSTGAEVALVGLGLDGEHALEEISEIVREAACPVIALIDAEDPSYVQEAAKRGVFAYVVLDGEEAAELQGALDITLRRFAEFQNLQGAFGTARDHRTSQGHPHGAKRHRRRRRLCSSEVALTAERPEAHPRGTSDHADPSAPTVHANRLSSHERLAGRGRRPEASPSQSLVISPPVV